MSALGSTGSDLLELEGKGVTLTQEFLLGYPDRLTVINPPGRVYVGTVPEVFYHNNSLFFLKDVIEGFVRP